MSRAVVATVMLMTLVALRAEQSPPAPQAVFRSAAHLVVQSVIANDKNGKPLAGLTTKDFVLTEDGVVQSIEFVEYQSLKDTVLPPMPGLATDAPGTVLMPGIAPVTTPAIAVPVAGDAKYRDRRLLALYLDIYNMGFFDQLRLYSSVRKYLTTRMTSADMVAVMVFDGAAVRLLSDFTDDRVALGRVVSALEAEAEDKRNDVGAVADAGTAFGQDNNTFNIFTTDRQLSALQTAATNLGPLPEVKTLIYFGSGLTLNGADNQAQLRATVNAAVRSNVTINPVDVRGLVATAPLGDATQASPGGVGMFNGALAQAGITREQRTQDTYYALAKDTGGLAMFNNNDLSEGVVRASQAVTGYYMIGYYTTHNDHDGKFRRVKVSLADGHDADLAYRPGYYGDKDFSKYTRADKERQLEDALRLEDPITEIPMAMEINYFQISSAEYFVPVSVRMPGSELARPRPNGASTAEIDMIGEIKDDFGVTHRNMRDKVTIKLDAATTADVIKRPIQFETGFTLLPGKYVIKVLARDATTGRMGTFQTSFVVPNLERDQTRLSTSSVVLSTQRVAAADVLYTVKQKISADMANPLIANRQKTLPSVTRTFKANGPLFVLMHAYERGLAATAKSRPLVAFVSFYRNGVLAWETAPTEFSDRWTPASSAIPIRFDLTLDHLAAGDYDCQITVLDPATYKAAFWRSAIVVVRP